MKAMNVEQGFWRKRVDAIEPAGDDHDVRASRRKLWLIVAAIAAVGAIIAYVMLSGGEKPAPQAPVLPRVTIVVPGRQPVTDLISATGNLAARREMPVGVAGEGGIVTRVLVEPGDWVGKGQVLATVDRQVQVQQSAQMHAQIAAAQADARLAQNELERAQKLVSRGFVSQADVERRTATRDAALARVRLSQAQYGEMNARLARLDIRSPEAGLVLARAIEPGQIVSSGGDPLFRLAKNGEMEMLARLAENDLARLAVGQSATVTPVGTRTGFKGQIWQLAPIIDPQTRQGTVRIALAYDKALRPGGFAAAEITSGRVDAPLLPESAVQSDEKGNFVYIIGAEDKVVRRDVKTGAVSNAGIAILSGLSGNERVVLSAGAFLNPGDKVIPERAKARP
ncbi:RND family efflux transporter, MFP subunit [Sphingomonas laterariae]|uniref:RND family efflux transporter, MFP subunit n=2 Tax=Edaphosphingomonas laterariae TaxID=861865 RepID=A0A239FKP4_9SPHN|nr:RND family efflux transporter, MFP subunit [Sphingomonas laterariae]